MAHGDAQEGKWRGNWRMEWVASTLHTTSEHGASSITTADAHTSAASSRLNWRPRRFKWTRPFRRKTKSGFCACAINDVRSTARSPELTSQSWNWAPHSGRRHPSLRNADMNGFRVQTDTCICHSFRSNLTSTNDYVTAECMWWRSWLKHCGRSRVRFPRVSMEIFIDIILPAALRPWGWISL